MEQTHHNDLKTISREIELLRESVAELRLELGTVSRLIAAAVVYASDPEGSDVGACAKVAWELTEKV